VFVPAWSLATEEQFYLFWPWIIAFSKRRMTPVYFMIGLIALNEFMRWRIGYWFYLDGYSFPITALYSVAPAICMGCLLAYALDRPRTFEMAWKALGQKWSAPLFFGLMLFVSTVPNDNTLHVFRMFYISIFLTLGLATCVIRQDHWLRGLLANKPIRYIGSISYGMYLYQTFALHFEEKFLTFAQQWPIAEFFAAAGVTALFAAISFATYEKVFLRLKKRFETPKSEAEPAVATA
jgi:peptidoglycan/LPS O-acetylase OafA/YrhL